MPQKSSGREYVKFFFLVSLFFLSIGLFEYGFTALATTLTGINPANFLIKFRFAMFSISGLALFFTCLFGLATWIDENYEFD